MSAAKIAWILPNSPQFYKIFTHAPIVAVVGNLLDKQEQKEEQEREEDWRIAGEEKQQLRENLQTVEKPKLSDLY